MSHECITYSKLIKFGLLLLERWSKHTFLYSSHEAQLESLDFIFERNIKMLRGEEKAADWLGTSGPKEQHAGGFQVFVCFMCPTLAAREANNPETPVGTNKHSPQKPAVSSQRRWKGQWKHTTARLQSNTTEKQTPHMQCRHHAGARTHPTPLPPHRGPARGGPVESQHSHPSPFRRMVPAEA